MPQFLDIGDFENAGNPLPIKVTLVLVWIFRKSVSGTLS